MSNQNRELTPQQKETFLEVLQLRFKKNTHRHIGLQWENIQKKLENNPEKFWSIHEMEKTGGEPDVIAYIAATDEYVFCDCATESPSERRSLCYDKEALDKRKNNKPKNNAMDLAKEIGIEILSQEDYLKLQKLENFDTKTSSWLKTPEEIRTLGGAIFGDFRFNQVFIYHNGAESYYAARGFRGTLKV